MPLIFSCGRCNKPWEWFTPFRQCWKLCEIVKWPIVHNPKHKREELICNALAMTLLLQKGLSHIVLCCIGRTVLSWNLFLPEFRFYEKFQGVLWRTDLGAKHTKPTSQCCGDSETFSTNNFCLLEHWSLQRAPFETATHKHKCWKRKKKTRKPVAQGHEFFSFVVACV